MVEETEGLRKRKVYKYEVNLQKCTPYCSHGVKICFDSDLAKKIVPNQLWKRLQQTGGNNGNKMNRRLSHVAAPENSAFAVREPRWRKHLCGNSQSAASNDERQNKTQHWQPCVCHY